MSKPRSFDWDEAVRLRATGMTYKAIADRLGVSDTAIYFAVKPEAYRASIRRRSEWQRLGTCPDCGAPSTRHNTKDQRRCRDCMFKAAVKRDADGNVWCPTCQTWKPTDEFSPSRYRPARGVHTECRSCDTARRTANREANRERDRTYDRERKRKLRQAA